MTLNRTNTALVAAPSPINQTTFQQLLASPSNVKLADRLVAQGYSTEISHLSINLHSAQQVDFSGCQFNEVTFTGNFQLSTFNHVNFKDSTFHQAEFTFSVFNHTDFNHCTFVDTHFDSASFINSHLDSVQSWNCNFADAAFAHSTIHHALFAKSNFERAVDYHNQIDDMHIVFTQAYPDLPFNQASLYPIHPTVALVGDNEWHDTPYYVVNKYCGNPTTIVQYAPSFQHDYLLSTEVKNVFHDIHLHGLQAPSIAQQVLLSQQPIIQYIKDYAYQMVAKADAIWIPGGPDLHPEFYGEVNTSSYTDWGFYREILEFAMTDAALAMDKPILGICHGSQLVNVYLGGTLHQHVSGQMGVTPLLEVLTHDGLVGAQLHEPLRGPSYHHQAVKDVAPALQVVAMYNGVVKAMQTVDGSKVMLCQFHPEYECDQSSQNIINKFMELSAESKIMEKMLALNEVLDFGHPIDKILQTLDNHQAPPHCAASVVQSVEPSWAILAPPTVVTLDHSHIAILA